MDFFTHNVKADIIEKFGHYFQNQIWTEFLGVAFGYHAY
jgi:hypothetical protein